MHVNKISRYIFIFIDTSEKIIILEREPIIDIILQQINIIYSIYIIIFNTINISVTDYISSCKIMSNVT